MGKRKRSGNGTGKNGKVTPNGATPKATPLKGALKGLPFAGFSIKKLSPEDRKRALTFGCAAIGLLLMVGLVLFLARPRLLWYVDEDLTAAWNRFLRDANSPVTRFEVRARVGDSPFPQGRFGFIVSTNGPQGELVPGTPLTIYPNLNRTRTFDGWQVLALDPWMVFRRHYIPEPSRSILNSAGDRGSLLLAGNDPRAVRAWTSQLLQESPGVFVPGEEVWRETGATLVRDYPFQSGAFSFSWIQTWPLLFRDGDSFLYAPLSQARAFAHNARHSAGLLDATTFPEPAGWNSFGLQANMLWARPQYGGERRRERLVSTEQWLGSAAVQTRIANEFEWIPAHPSGTPYNTISWQSQMAWLRSSYVWRGMEEVHAY
ncbi:MAG: hypothetical protein FWB78_06200 [Treponema sp.]|nr:hypothetical protein [Treponema sp.]